ncbi:hypothetical protein C2S52_021754 [Perilla frutescens var. hirtella]|nr:hypothetical protein C2S52_021754 [Perilla frutescens var. hirtella]
MPSFIPTTLFFSLLMRPPGVLKLLPHFLSLCTSIRLKLINQGTQSSCLSLQCIALHLPNSSLHLSGFKVLNFLQQLLMFHLTRLKLRSQLPNLWKVSKH